MALDFNFDRSPIGKDLNLRELTRLCEDALVTVACPVETDWRGKIMAHIEILSAVRDTEGRKKYVSQYNFAMSYAPKDDEHPDDDPVKQGYNSQLYVCRSRFSTLEYGKKGTITLSDDYRVDIAIIHRNSFGDYYADEDNKTARRYIRELKSSLRGTGFIAYNSAPP